MIPTTASPKTRFVSLALLCLMIASFALGPVQVTEDVASQEIWTAWIESMSTPKTTYDLDETVNVTVTVERGPDALTAVWEGTLTLAVVDWTGDAVHFDSLPVALWNGGAEQTSHFEFELSDAGDYLLSTTLYWRNETLDSRDLNITVFPTPVPGDATVWISSLRTDKETYQQGDVMDATVVVTRGPDLLTYVWEGVLTIHLLDTDRNMLGTWSGPVNLSEGGAEQTLSHSFDLVDAGDRILVASLYRVVGTFVDERFLNFTVTQQDTNHPPVAVIDPQWQAVAVADTARLDGSSSHDDDGRIASYVWDLGDGTTVEGVTVDHQYQGPGLYNVTLIVTDEDGATAVAHGQVEVLGFNDPPWDTEAWITSITAPGGNVSEGDTINVSVSVVRGDDMLDYVWLGTLVLQVIDNGTLLTLSEQVELATGGDASTLGFHFVLDEEGRYLVRASLYRQDDALMDTEGAWITVVGEGPTPMPPPDRAPLDVPTSAVAAAGILVIIGALGATEAGKASLLGLLLPLYTKLKKEEILDHFTRGKIYGYILANPGDHYNSIQKAVNVPNGTFAYHLHVLEKEGYIKSRREGTYRCFYPAGMKIPEGERTLKAGERMVVERILEEPGISQKEIAASLGVSSSTVNYHLKGLLQLGVVERERLGMRLRYYVNWDAIATPS
jgi:predicted transcriptional regulator